MAIRPTSYRVEPDTLSWIALPAELSEPFRLALPHSDLYGYRDDRAGSTSLVYSLAPHSLIPLLARPVPSLEKEHAVINSAHAPAYYPDVVVMFIAVSGFETDSPEEVFIKLGRITELIRYVAHKKGGYVKNMEQETLLVFGTDTKAPGAKAFEAIQTLGEIQNLIQQSYPHLRITAGASFGDINMATLGLSGRQERDVFGHTVNKAKRVFQTPHGGVAIDDSLFRILDPTTQRSFQSREYLSLKGFPEPNLIHFSDGSDLPGMDSTLFVPEQDLPIVEEQAIAQVRKVYLFDFDVQGFSTQSSHMPAAKVYEWIGPIFGYDEQLEENGGITVMRAGDENLVRYGVPSFGDERLNAAMAVKGAWDFRNYLRTINKDRNNFPPLSGRYAVGEATLLIKGRRTAGKDIDQVREMQSMGEIDAIIVDQKTADLIRPFFELDPVSVGDDTYRVVDMNQAVLDLSRRQFQEITDFGRETQGVALEQAFSLVEREGELKSSILLGPEGSGRRATVARFLVHSPTPLIHLTGHATPWQSDPLRGALRNYYDNFGESPDKLQKLVDDIIDSNLTQMVRYGAEADAIGFADPVSMLHYFLGYYLRLPVVAPQKAKNYLEKNPLQVLYWVQYSLELYLRFLARQGPLVLELQGLENCDPDRMQFVSQVLNRVLDCPIYVIGLSSNLAHSNWSILPGLEKTQPVYFYHLDRGTSEKLIVHWVNEEWIRMGHQPAHPLPDDLSDRIFNEAGRIGHPGDLVGIIRMLLHGGYLKFTELGGWELDWTEDIPVHRDEARLASFDRLSDIEKKVVMAVASGICWPQAILSVFTDQESPYFSHWNLTRKEIFDVMSALEQKGFLLRDSSSDLVGHIQYRISPARLHTLIYQGNGSSISGVMLEGDKKHYHQGALAWFEKTYHLAAGQFETSEAAHEIYGLAGFHALRAKEGVKAYDLFREGINRAKVRYANEAVLDFVEGAFASLPYRVSRYGLDAKQVADIHIELLNERALVFERRGWKEEWDRVLGQLEDLGEHQEDEQKFQIVLQRANYKVIWREVDDIWFERQQQTWDYRLHLLPPQAMALFYLTWGRYFSFVRGNLPRAIQLYEQAMNSSVDNQTKAFCYLGRSTAFLRQGRNQEALVEARTAGDFFAQEFDFENQAKSLVTAGAALMSLAREGVAGLYDEAVAVLTQAKTLAQRVGHREVMGHALLNLAMTLAEVRNIPESLAQIEEAIVLATMRGRELPSLEQTAYFQKAVVISQEDPEQGVIAASQALGGDELSAIRANAFFARALSYFRWRNKSGDSSYFNLARDDVNQALAIRTHLGSIQTYDQELLVLADLLQAKRDGPSRRPHETHFVPASYLQDLQSQDFSSVGSSTDFPSAFVPSDDPANHSFPELLFEGSLALQAAPLVQKEPKRLVEVKKENTSWKEDVRAALIWVDERQLDCPRTVAILQQWQDGPPEGWEEKTDFLNLFEQKGFPIEDIEQDLEGEEKLVLLASAFGENVDEFECVLQEISSPGSFESASVDWQVSLSPLVKRSIPELVRSI